MLSNVDCKFLQTPFDYCSNFASGKNYDFRKILIKRGEKNEPHFLKGVANGLELLYVCLV